MRRLALALILVAIGGLVAWWATRPAGQPSAEALELAPATPPAFERALTPRVFAFPEDHGPHYGFQTEWWYYTGNLESSDGGHFGYQLTFFRRGLLPAVPTSTADLITSEIYFAHFAITDVQGQAHPFAERFSRGAGGLAGASGRPFQVWLEDWSVQSLSPDGSSVRLHAADGGWAIDLQLQSVKPIVEQGEAGLSAKSAQPGNASYYLSYTRLRTDGSLRIDGQEVNVTGESWFDHEWSTSALGPQAIGWDWYSLQLGDGRELMLFQVRNADGTIDPASAGTVVAQDGSARALGSNGFTVTVLDHWRSPTSQGAYPSRWRLEVPSLAIDATIQPWMSDQEMRVSFPYWEGAVRLSGTAAGQPVGGNGYIELTGYARSMQGVF